MVTVEKKTAVRSGSVVRISMDWDAPVSILGSGDYEMIGWGWDEGGTGTWRDYRIGGGGSVETRRVITMPFDVALEVVRYVVDDDSAASAPIRAIGEAFTPRLCALIEAEQHTERLSDIRRRHELGLGFTGFARWQAASVYHHARGRVEYLRGGDAWERVAAQALENLKKLDAEFLAELS